MNEMWNDRQKAFNELKTAMLEIMEEVEKDPKGSIAKLVAYENIKKIVSGLKKEKKEC